MDILRRSFYEVYDSRQAMIDEGNAVHVKDNITLDHVLHCIEFLRQSIMCHADTTIEAEDIRLHGVVGFGIAHSCRRWDQMVEWVDNRNNREAD